MVKLVELLLFFLDKLLVYSNCLSWWLRLVRVIYWFESNSW